MSKYKPYTKKEIEVICSYANKYPSNIKMGLEEAASKIGRNVSSVTTKYYSIISSKQTPYMAITNGTSTIINKKNSPRIKNRNKIKIVSKAIEALNKQEQLEIMLTMLTDLNADQVGNLVAELIKTTK